MIARHSTFTIRAFASTAAVAAATGAKSDAPGGAKLALKYADKLKARMEREGVSDLEQLKAKLAPSPAAPPEKLGSLVPPPSLSAQPASTQKDASLPSRKKWTRKDSSPIKPLSALLNVPKIMRTPHTAAEVSSLWTLYHASRSEGTGRGYLSATVPRDKYEGMIARARKYPMFVLPLPRAAAATSSSSSSLPGGDGSGASGGATEFFFMEWGFHSAPEHPSRVDPLADPFAVIGSSAAPLDADAFTTPTAATAAATAATTGAAAPAPARLPPRTTILFTPLEEYKLRGSFAQPRLVVTHHTDLADSHAIVLLRGEITASPSGGFLLSQMDAQLLALAVQKFYLPGGTPQSQNDFQILRSFHEAQDQFDYKKLLAAIGNDGFGTS